MFAKTLLSCAFVILTASAARADFLREALQQEVKNVLTPVVRDIGLGISSGMNTKAGSLSFPGFEASAKSGFISVSSDNELIDSDYTAAPVLSAEAGLPGNVDVFMRGMALSLGGETISILGGGVRYTLIDDSPLLPLPSVSATAGMNRLGTGDNISITATTIGASVSKKLLFITPYAGISYEMLNGEFDTTEAGTLKTEEELVRFNLGTELNPFPAVFVSAGIDMTSESDSGMSFYSALGARISLP
ncbi:MAG: DUF6588 family protein [Elusimicrobiota bacterium]